MVEMRVFLGMILGFFLTVAGAYLYDAATTGTEPTAQASENRPMVNWDVAERNWQQFTSRVRQEWNKLTAR
jgi:uncharacterized membrane protein